MKIQAPGTLRTNAPRRSAKSDKGSGSSFASHIRDGAAAGSAPVSGSAQIGSVEALLAVQGNPALSGDANAAGVLHAEDLLDRLDAIRVGILTGRVSRASLEDIVRRLESRRRGGSDPRLTDLINDIELRAKVELAKLSML
jgi:hypothetical protein